MAPAALTLVLAIAGAQDARDALRGAAPVEFGDLERAVSSHERARSRLRDAAPQEWDAFQAMVGRTRVAYAAVLSERPQEWAMYLDVKLRDVPQVPDHFRRVFARRLPRQWEAVLAAEAAQAEAWEALRRAAKVEAGMYHSSKDFMIDQARELRLAAPDAWEAAADFVRSLDLERVVLSETGRHPGRDRGYRQDRLERQQQVLEDPGDLDARAGRAFDPGSGMQSSLARSLRSCSRTASGSSGACRPSRSRTGGRRPPATRTEVNPPATAAVAGAP